MSKPFDYSKWDNIELSDDEEDVHPNIDKESWFRMKHRSRVEREQHEEADKKRIKEAMEKANQRIMSLKHDLNNIKTTALQLKDEDDDDDDDDLDDGEALKAEIAALEKENAVRQAKLDEYERNKKWNVDNMCVVKDERTMINPDGAKNNYTETGFAKSTTDGSDVKIGTEEKKSEEKPKATTTTKEDKKPAAAAPAKQKATTTTTTKTTTTTTVAKKAGPTPSGPQRDASDISIMSYYEFTEKYSDTVENFMAITDLEASKEFLLKNGNILLQENASNYLLLASLEDEMNGYREKMKQTARQSQLISSIADLARSLNTHPGNVIIPFFGRLQQKEYLDGFLSGVKDFQEKIVKRAVTKKIEMDREREGQAGQGVELQDVPPEQRLGPGGLDPLEVVETLPQVMRDAFESRDVEVLKEALLSLDPKDAEYHMKRCIDSGLWVNQS
ncbi:Hsp90 co-chaperone Cdc37 [Seminavis robusta]|uniref:Hsp90 chaperone protein kinase-targeting subunit n=1 Tax=Seminavis robusta TaxID=568900 RepID=A0A9N8DTZ6_9STRA|nr:Hsp90 co-chaperone Cdc37 [Seminavis robusta]|eukprot:Sro355_g124940.1 Hsp90 co-chaperone Cdc37 (445) ;mRNA; f:5519-6984